MKPEDAKPGATYLVHDTGESDWSLWQRSEDNKLNRMLVSWRGHVAAQDTPYSEPVDAWPISIPTAIFEVRPENVEGIIMAARHMPDAEAWYRFAWRQSERQAL